MKKVKRKLQIDVKIRYNFLVVVTLSILLLTGSIIGKVESEEAKEALNIADKLSDMILFHSRTRDNGTAIMKPWEV